MPGLPQYDRGAGGFAALVGGALQGIQAGYAFRQQRDQDREAKADRERKRLEDAIRLRIDLENAGYDPDDLDAGQQAPGKTGGLVEGGPTQHHPGHAPMDEDPRDFGISQPSIIGFGKPAGPTAPTSQGPTAPADNIRSRIAGILFQGVPKMRRGESAQERAARVQYERQVARDSTQDAAVMERERYQQTAQDARQAAQLAAQERMNDADNATSTRNAQIAAASREDVAGIHWGSGGGGTSNDPNIRRVQGLITAQKGVVDGLDRAIRLAESRIPKEIPLSMTEAQFQQQYGPQLAAVQELHARRDREDAKRVAMIDKMLQGDLDFSDLVPGAGPPPSGVQAGPSFAMDQERQMYQRAAEKIMSLGLAPEEQQRRLEELTRRYNARVSGQK